MAREQYTTAGASTLASGYTAGDGVLLLASASTFPAGGVFSVVVDPDGTPLWFTCSAVSSNDLTVTVEQGTDHNVSSGAKVIEVQTARSLNAIRGECAILDTTANRPAAGVAGRLFLPTDGPIIQRDNGSGWDGVDVGARLTDPNLQSWTTLNLGNTVQTTSSNGNWRSLVNPGDGTTSVGWSIEVISLPASPTTYALELGMIMNMAGSDGADERGGLVMRNSSNGKLVTVGWLFQSRSVPKQVVYGWNDYINYASTISADPNVQSGPCWPVHYIRVEASSTNLKFLFSADGLDWADIATLPRDYFIGSAADQAGYSIWSGGNYRNGVRLIHAKLT